MLQVKGKEMEQKIYVFDLDDTLCKSPKPESWLKDSATLTIDYSTCKPIQHRIDVVNRLYDEGHIIIIDTARGSVTGQSAFYDTMKQLLEWGVKFHHLRTNVKFAAHYYIDDKGINDKGFFFEEDRKNR
jgi:hypothetical protein